MTTTGMEQEYGVALAITNIGTVVSGDIDNPILEGADTVICADGAITHIGAYEDLRPQVEAASTVIDAQGTVVAPGLIDSHCHVVLGDYTPRQKTVDFLESYVHGGITAVISPSEAHAPGRPHDRLAVKALAIAARACFLNFRPAGMKVYAGCVILEPDLQEDDFREMQAAGVWIAKFGFGAYKDPIDAEPQIRWAKQYGMIVMSHCGGASIPGSSPILARHLLHLRPHVLGHVNGGPTALPDEDVDRLVRESDMALQIVQAGNLRSTLRIVRLAVETGNLSRLIIGSDTPTGTGVMPLSILKTMAEIASLAGLPPAVAWACASGNNARVYGLDQGTVRVGAPADLVIMDTPWGSQGKDALDALALGDIPGISAVIIDGEVRLFRSRNTPPATRQAQVVRHQPVLSGAR